ncbi:glycerol-3-phosphate dehydrogenase [Bradyrhizobium tropiciagri]|uniref:glycerol-3-phosphate dehydrogenase n=1 Tax=Bradyrhizobium tropiciagri TaxID=312253 RepID=UPI001BAE3BD8|nr:glycerol-3-phosphate dehydrogenase [Bradyrhizobium tropiciagri]MBR0898992.1 glycerol-3-phosphate dehydrogenase [Bradyrhizobium tropiciagri]
MASDVDLFVIGGGINGAAIARDAAGRGLRVVLAEKGDYGHATSSSSTKLIHGGLRYLENFEFRLVRESLREREVMLRIAPHLVTPLRFLLPTTTDQPRSYLSVRAGLFLYDMLAGRGTLESTGALTREEAGALPRLRKENVTAVLHYPDCWADDSRLVLETLLDARNRGAIVSNYTEVMSVRGTDVGYAVTTRNCSATNETRARFVVNAAGPWVNMVADRIEGAPVPLGVKLVRGSHIVLPMPAPSRDYAYILQNPDKRIVMVVPWLGKFLIVGSTHEVQQSPNDTRCSDEEKMFLLECYNRFFDDRKEINDIVWSYAGVRPLVDDGETNGSQVTRDYRLVQRRRGSGGIVSVYGGKLTTHRVLANHVMACLRRMDAKLAPEWTASAPLHGGNLSVDELRRLSERSSTVPFETRRRWVRTYGSETQVLLDAAHANPDLAKEVAAGVTEGELRYVVDVEDVRTAEDFLYRRSKLFILLDDSERTRVAEWFARRGLDYSRAA